MQEPEIRLLQMEDRERAERFFAQMAPDSRAFFNRNNINLKGIMRFFNGTDKQAVRRWIAVQDGEMVGYVFLWDTDTMIPWLGVAVAESMRGRHFGQTLIGVAEDWCRSQGKGGIMLTTSMANIRAQVLYERCGFMRLGVHSASNELLYLRRF